MRVVGEPVTPAQFDALFDTFRATAVRLEGLPAYEVAEYEGARLAAFRSGRPLPVRSVKTDPWMARIARTSAQGKLWQRVRVVDEPLTDYQAFELAVYPETQAVGEDIYVVTRRELRDEGPDFWLFDGGTPAARMVLMHYDAGGQWLGADLVHDPHVIHQAQDTHERTLALSIGLNEFLAVSRR
jgi:hypothetical protein